MKFFLHSLLLLVAGLGLLATVPSLAQTFPNSNFDMWVTRKGIELPDNWLTTDEFLGGLVSTSTVTKTSVSRSGFAAQLQTKDMAGVGSIPSFIVLGTAFRRGPITGTTAFGGPPFTARPQSPQFYYQLSGPQVLADSAAVVVLLTRRVNGSNTTVAEASCVLRALATSYTLVTRPLQYTPALPPDSVSMAFFSGVSKKTTVGTTLLVDDVAFTGTITATRDAALADTVSVSPNPSPAGCCVLNATEPALLAAPLAIIDATGRVVRREEAARTPAATRLLDLSELPGACILCSYSQAKT